MERSSVAESIVDLSRRWAATTPGALAFVSLRDGEDEEARVTVAELDSSARTMAAFLQRRTSPGDRILLAYPSGIEFVSAFLGALYAGLVPVPVSLPRHPRNLARFQAIAADCGARLGLTDRATAPKLHDWQASDDAGSLEWLSTDRDLEISPESWQPTPIESTTLALLQYTSGSTGSPRGVMVTHGNMLANARAIGRAFEHSERTIVVGWVPLFHDMGLIANVIQPLYRNIPSILMSPVAFLQKPHRWLSTITKYRATTSGGPNFAYELCCERVTEAQRATLDLSSWDVAFNGAEPVRAQTLARFAETFGPCGFRRDAFCASYGLAESTLFATGGPKGSQRVVCVDEASLGRGRVVKVPADSPKSNAIVGCGRSQEEARIVDPHTCVPCEDGTIGEIWLRGPSVASGYFGQPTLSDHTFGGQIAGESGPPYLRTEDLGFMQGDEVFLTGRRKDIIIIRGQNHYPQDIEYTVARSNAALEPGGGAAFSIEEENAECLIILQEISRELEAGEIDAIFTDIRRAVTRNHDLQVHAIVLLAPKTIPKTSSGKIQRGLCRSRFLDGTLEHVADTEEYTHPSPAAPA